jgi:tyrosine-protein phosphatase YwqE
MFYNNVFLIPIIFLLGFFVYLCVIKLFKMEKEQQKQHLIDMMRGDEELGLYDETIDSIKLEEVLGSKHCLYSVIENKLATLYRNQEKILSAIKILNNGRK